MSDQFDQAAEELAPRPAQTNFFGGDSTTGMLARYGGRSPVAGAAQEQAAAQSRLTQSRLARAADRQRRKLWDREDEEYDAKKSFENTRGEFLNTLARIDENADDFEDSLNEILATSSEEALKDPAVRAILTHKQRIARERRSALESEKREARYIKRYEDRSLADAAEKAALAGVDQGRIDEYLAARKPELLYLEAGRAERTREAAEEAAKGVELPSRTDATAEMKLSFEDLEAYPATPTLTNLLKEYQAGDGNGKADYDDLKAAWPDRYATAYREEFPTEEGRIAEARRYQTRSDYMDLVPNIGEAARERRGRVWDLAHGLFGQTTTMLPGDERMRAEGRVNVRGAGEETTETPATPEIQAEKTVNGVRYIMVNGQWGTP